MPIVPLPVFEADADPARRSALSDTDIYEALQPPKSIVVRFGSLKLVGEFNYEGEAKPGCGTKMVVRTHRGTELAEMLTTTCENAGCSKSVTRQEMLEYIENSGGKDYPFHRNGRILRVATIEDLNKQAALEAEKPRWVRACRQLVQDMALPMKLVDVEPILGGELITFYYMSEKRVDFRELVRALAAECKTRIEMRQVGARDEARLVADYERCGQHCCCQGFLKVLKPISMKAAKLQKATLDPLKISGRCGRLMCCLRYEDQTYRELKKNLPLKGTRVGTREGPGTVIDGRILVQLVLVRLEHEPREVAVPVEELLDPEECPRPGAPAKVEAPDGLRGLSSEEVRKRVAGREPAAGETAEEPRRRRRRRRSKGERQDEYRQRAERQEGPEARDRAPARPAQAPEPAPEAPEGGPTAPETSATGEAAHRKRRRRRRRKRGPGPAGAESPPS